MGGDHEDIKRLMTQYYDPTRDRVTQDFFQEFRTKRFDDANIAETFHENTKNTPVKKHKLERSAELFLNDEAFQYSTKNVTLDYEGYDRYSLPKPEERPHSADLFETLQNRRSTRNFSRDTISSETLSTFLHHSVGVSDDLAGKAVRTYPSAGGLYPVEPYLHLSADVGHLPSGAYHYVPDEHSLRRIRSDDEGDDVLDLFADADGFDYSCPELNVFLTASFWRSYAKYGPRAYRYILQEVGHICQNIQLVATALELGSIPRAGYLDDRVNEYLRIDGVNEAVVSTITVGSSNEVGHE